MTFGRWHSSTVFTLVALCFVLPFATVTSLSSCESGREPYGRPATITGIQLVTRTVPYHTSEYFAPAVESAGSTGAEIAFVAALVGLLLGIRGAERGSGWCSAIGLGALLYLPVSAKFSSYGLQWSPSVGWWLAVAFFIWAGILHVRRWRERRSIPGYR